MKTMEGYDDAALGPTLSDAPIPIPPAPRSAGWSGWLIGVLCGVLVGLWVFPTVRYTLAAQLEFALAEESLPWLSSLDAKRSAHEAARLSDVAGRYPDDYLLQVGRATAMATTGGVREAPPPTNLHGDDEEYSDHTLFRLGKVARGFPTIPGAYAHLARYLMIERIRIQRAEIGGAKATREKDQTSAQTVTPSRRNLEIMLWALRSGERLDPDNAFWPTMLATTYFAADQDSDAIAALSRAARKKRWDAYIYEEVLGQWRLYSAAYGDHGATQQVGPLSLVIFPHLREIRHMAEMARWRAEQAALIHHDEEAARIRRSLARLGVNLRDNAGWAFEALYGTALFFIACTDSEAAPAQNEIRTMAQWEAHAARYHALLQRMHREFEFRLLRTDVQYCCDLRQRVDLARYDASYPGVPPGIPLGPLFGSWMAGICLVQQALGILIAVTIAWCWERTGRRSERIPSIGRKSVLILFLLATVATGVMFALVAPTPRLAALLFLELTVLMLLGIEHLWRWFHSLNAHYENPDGQRSIDNLLRWGEPAGAENSVSMDAWNLGLERGAQWLDQEQVEVGEERWEPGAVNDGGASLAQSIKEASWRWTNGTTFRMLLVVVLPYLVILFSQRDVLRGLHPVAILLTSLTGFPHVAGTRDAIHFALLAGALPLALPLACAFWGAYRGVSPISSALVGVRRLALPCLVSLAVAYAVVLDQTLILDAEASQAIQKAAQNDRQWVLTHGAEGGPF